MKKISNVALATVFLINSFPAPTVLAGNSLDNLLFRQALQASQAASNSTSNQTPTSVLQTQNSDDFRVGPIPVTPTAGGTLVPVRTSLIQSNADIVTEGNIETITSMPLEDMRKAIERSHGFGENTVKAFIYKASSFNNQPAVEVFYRLTAAGQQTYSNATLVFDAKGNLQNIGWMQNNPPAPDLAFRVLGYESFQTIFPIVRLSDVTLKSLTIKVPASSVQENYDITFQVLTVQGTAEFTITGRRTRQNSNAIWQYTMTNIPVFAEATVMGPESRNNLTDFLALLKNRGIDAARFPDLSTVSMPNFDPQYLLIQSGRQVAIAISGEDHIFSGPGGPTSIISRSTIFYLSETAIPTIKPVRIEGAKIIRNLDGSFRFGFTNNTIPLNQLAVQWEHNSAILIDIDGKTVAGVKILNTVPNIPSLPPGGNSVTNPNYYYVLVTTSNPLLQVTNYVIKERGTDRTVLTLEHSAVRGYNGGGYVYAKGLDVTSSGIVVRGYRGEPFTSSPANVIDFYDINTGKQLGTIQYPGFVPPSSYPSSSDLINIKLDKIEIVKNGSQEVVKATFIDSRNNATQIRYYDPQTRQLLPQPVPAGWTRSASTPTYAYTFSYSRNGSQYYYGILKVLDLNNPGDGSGKIVANFNLGAAVGFPSIAEASKFVDIIGPVNNPVVVYTSYASGAYPGKTILTNINNTQQTLALQGEPISVKVDGNIAEVKTTTGTQRVNLSTLTVISVPEGWTQSASNPKFAFQKVPVGSSSERLQILNLNVYDPSKPISAINGLMIVGTVRKLAPTDGWTMVDVTADGKYFIAASHNSLPENQIIVAPVNGYNDGPIKILTLKNQGELQRFQFNLDGTLTLTTTTRTIQVHLATMQEMRPLPTGWTRAATNPDFAYRNVSDSLGLNNEAHLLNLVTGQDMIVGFGSQIRHNPGVVDTDGKVVLVSYHEGGPIVGQLSGVEFHRLSDLVKDPKNAYKHAAGRIQGNYKSHVFQGNLIVVNMEVYNDATPDPNDTKVITVTTPRSDILAILVPVNP